MVPDTIRGCPGSVSVTIVVLQGGTPTEAGDESERACCVHPMNAMAPNSRASKTNAKIEKRRRLLRFKRVARPNISFNLLKSLSHIVGVALRGHPLLYLGDLYFWKRARRGGRPRSAAPTTQRLAQILV